MASNFQPDVNRQPDICDYTGRIDQEKLNQAESNGLNILVTGKTGSGKSTIVNGILGLDFGEDKAAAEEGDDISERCTTEVKDFTAVRNGVTVTVWDSPGLQDGTTDQAEYLEHMKQKCNERDLTLYCINASASRYVPGEDNKDLVAMKKLTKTFGPGFWTNVVIILTFANNIILSNPRWARLSQDEKNQKFEEKISKWKGLIQDYLCDFVGVPKEIVDKVTIIPAGYYTESKLFNREYWLSDLWVECFKAIPSPEQRATFYYFNEGRIVKVKDATEEELRRALGRQPIYLTEEEIKMYREIKKRGAKLGAVIGTAVGGPFMPITGLVGFIIGKKLGKQRGEKKVLAKKGGDTTE